jgi:hypothetical protein
VFKERLATRISYTNLFYTSNMLFPLYTVVQFEGVYNYLITFAIASF